MLILGLGPKAKIHELYFCLGLGLSGFRLILGLDPGCLRLAVSP